MDPTEDDEFIDDYDGLDYEVIPRPQELIDRQKMTSTEKILIESDIEKKDLAASKRLFERKQSSRSRDRERNSSRHDKKSSSKEKTSHKSPLNEGSPVKKSVELSKRYEALRKIIQQELGDSSKSKQRSESLKIQKDEHDSSNSKSKKSGQDKNLCIPVSKIMKEPAVTAMQRFQVLDARDAALRSSMSRPEGSGKIVIIGTCPDMCPEKERYGRIAKNCVSVLEMTSTFDPNASSHDADHSCMIKEYSRSSADQQEPLPHELRPVSILKLTMDYLICNVIDKYHESVSLEDWYDFIWNRTRSIRKDITQQQLCDPVCVEIIEKCVRFHIHCAEALSEEDTATFDPKINNENLTKCLQTLKHMYEDLQSKGIETPNEAEFRSYDILLSLTEGETLRLIKDIRKDLLKSPLIKSAFEAALAFNSDNYVKFFQIISKADYLSSCILHRYIIKVRSNALQIIVRAYATQHNTSTYPISRLVNDLKFENEAEAADFCRCHGLETNEESIIIDRKQFSKSPSGVPVSRSCLLVGHKKGNNLGLIINNGTLPLNPKETYQPHNSFDKNNMLKIDNIGAVKEDIGNVLSVNKVLEQEEEEMETEDKLPLSDNFSYNSKTETQLEDSNIIELERRRAELLDELNEVESHSSVKQKQKREHSSKKIEKKKSSKKSQSPSKSQKTDSHQSFQKVEDVPGSFFKPAAINASSFSKLSPHTDSSFFKFSTLSSSKAFDMPYASNSAKEFIPPKDFTTVSNVPVSSSATSSVFSQPSLPTSNFPTFSFQEHRNFGFSFKSTMPATFSSTPFVSKSDGENLHQGTDVYQSFCFSRPKIIDDKLRKTALEKTAVTQQVEIITDDSESCNSKDVIKEVPYEMVSQKSICLPDEKVIQVEEIETLPKIIEAEIPEEIASDFLTEDPEKINNDVIEDTIEESDNEIFTEERKKCELINKFVDEIADEVLCEVVEDCTPAICEEVIKEERKNKAAFDHEIAKIREQLAWNAFYKWRIFVQKKREKRISENIAFYSPWQAILLNIPRISSGAISPFVAYKKHCFLTKTTAEILKKRLEVPPGWEKYDAEQIWTLKSFKKPYVDISYFGNSRIKNFFKLCIVFPCDRDSNTSLLKEWISSKFGLQETDSSKFDCRNVFRLHKEETVVVVRSIELTSDIGKPAKFLDGVTAMMAFVPSHSKDREDFLTNLIALRDSTVLDSPYPLFMYFMGLHSVPTDMPSNLKKKIDISFTSVKMQCIPNIDNFFENSRKILSSLMWFNEIEDKARPLPVLKKVSFRHYVEDAFSYAFSILLCKVSLDEYKFLLEDPQFMIDFFNQVMKFRASVLCNDFIKAIRSCWPPEEIKDLLGEWFIDMQTQNLCRESMENILLPDFNGDPYDTKAAWEFARRIPSCSNLFLSIKISDSSIDWLQKIIYCAENLIQNSDFILKKGDVPVYYIYEDLADFACEPYWLNVLAEMLPHRNSSKRKFSVPFDSLSPLKKSKVGPYQSTPKVCGNNVQNMLAKPMRDNSTSEDTTALNHRLSSLVVDNEKNSFELYHENFLYRWKKNSSAEINKENDYIEVPDSSTFNSSSKKAIGSERHMYGLFHNNMLYSKMKRDILNDEDNWKEIGIKKPSGNTWASLAEKLSELQYNIQQNTVLEDHFYDLLNKQL